MPQQMRARNWIACFGVILVLAGVARTDDSKTDPKTSPAKPKLTAEQRRLELEKKFAQQLSGATFAGQYTMAGQKEGVPPQMERYTIAKVSKLPKGDSWLFEARIQYGKYDLTVPMILDVKWADDTPVISLSDLTIPGLGTFTSRVLVYGDRYAGTWQHGEAGGHLWGRIEKAAPIAKPAPAKPAEAK
jgi:hypothetical protein